MDQEFFSFDSLLSLTIASTDVGDLLINPKTNLPEKQFLMRGTIKKARAGLFFITIEDKNFTTHKNSQFTVGEEVAVVIEPQIAESSVVDFLIVGLEKIEQ